MSAMDVGHIDTYSPGSDVNGQRSGAILCLPGFWAPQSVVLTTGPSHMSALALVVTHDCALVARMSPAKPAAQVAAKPAAQPAAGEPIPVAPAEHVQLFKVKYSRQKKWHTEPVSQ
eukprot:CAMPEP_0174280360 /NCGR_PEP_ID=MMETSP0809-20121228/643_1 /TAXON_ID=73025 ORGANISM="Eutreptiella gymnastica-like, Strain CCMP1594" /NCGR_SAMPLE_ID=MMETSP0809 /ASSEMBLY_ACC=CAM_ASM_000658 /LENGTH=115 /DNA_ID=CAMNT_0015373195 /DNA_START=1242 /DNA_END=1588 /DNA_ORIENTATION=+